MRLNHESSSRILKARDSSVRKVLGTGHRRNLLSIDHPDSRTLQPKPKLLKHRYQIEETIKRGLSSTLLKCRDNLKDLQVTLKMFTSSEDAK